MTKDEIKEAASRLGCWAVPYARLHKSEAHNRALIALVQEAVQVEREAIAKFCESNQVTREAKGGRTFMPFEADGGIHEGMDYAKAIRARGQQ